MHGRIKMISTEEQKKKQNQAREEKLKLFTAATQLIFRKREALEYDEEALKITADVLLSNPNIITFWNFRREIILIMLENPEKENLLCSELTLTEQCLRSDPKSYGTWHQRLWVLERMPKNVWENELKLCNKMLALDERNFHCWDYRKIVVQRANVPPIDEFKFTTEKIESNFSNYSAWHFRSKVLPILFEDPSGHYPIEPTKHKEELELVLNAAFTDPDDQSAWFYQRWLLNLLKFPTKLLWAQASSLNVVIGLSREIRLKEMSSFIVVSTNDGDAAGEWQSLSRTDHSSCWRFQFAAPVTDGQIIKISANAEKLSDFIQVECNALEKRQQSFLSEFSPDVKATLEDQLKSCSELLELEPDSKWTLLTSVMLMRSLNLLSLSDRIFANLNKLKEVDCLRKGYYIDLASQITMELAITKNQLVSDFRLANAGLSCLYHVQYFGLATTVNLSGNNLNSEDLVQLYALVNCSELNLNNNNITKIIFLPRLQKLVSILFDSNPIEDPERDLAYLKTFPQVDIAKITL